MKSILVPLEDWSSFCGVFSQQHQGLPVRIGTLETAAYEKNPKLAGERMTVVAPAQPLGLLRPVRSGAGVRLEVELGEGEPRTSHAIESPTRIRFEQTSDGAHVGLAIDGADGQTTLVHFSPPVPSDQVRPVSMADVGPGRRPA